LAEEQVEGKDMLKRYIAMLVAIVTPGQWRGHLLSRLGILGACGQGGLFCTTRIGTEPSLITIGSHTVIASDVLFANHDMAVTVAGRYLGRGNHECYGEIKIGDSCFIGARSILLPGVNICNGAIIGAGSIVTHSIEKPGVYTGSGPKFVCTLAGYFEKNIALSAKRHADLAAAYPDLFCIESGRVRKLRSFAVGTRKRAVQ
jgi:acetyltransferase-like isoleucine patch superfamily enzyme